MSINLYFFNNIFSSEHKNVRRSVNEKKKTRQSFHNVHLEWKMNKCWNVKFYNMRNGKVKRVAGADTTYDALSLSSLFFYYICNRVKKNSQKRKKYWKKSK